MLRMNPLMFVDGLIRDARHVLRLIRLNPDFSAAAILRLRWELAQILSMLFGVEPFDGLTLTDVASLLTFVAMIAALFPANRAPRIDPTEALRDE